MCTWSRYLSAPRSNSRSTPSLPHLDIVLRHPVPILIELDVVKVFNDIVHSTRIFVFGSIRKSMKPERGIEGIVVDFIDNLYNYYISNY